MAQKTPAETIKQLSSHDQREVAIALSDLFIKQVEIEFKPHANVIKSLRKMRDIIWENDDAPATNGSYEADSKSANQRKERIAAVIETVQNPDERQQLAEAYVRLGHIYELAGHQARHNFIKSRREKLTKFFGENSDIKTGAKEISEQDSRRLFSPGGTHELIYTHPVLSKEQDVSKIVDLLSTPESEFVFTQHPTNTNTLDSMQTQRAIGKSLNEVVKNVLEGHEVDSEKLDDLRRALGKFVKDPIVSDVNFTAKDETDIVVNFLSNAYNDLRRVYDVTENPLKEKFGDQYDIQQRKALDLKFRFSSWGSAGDKDGNKNIKSENTLEAIVLHKQKAADLISNDLKQIAELSPELSKWYGALMAASGSYTVLISDIEAEREKDPKGNDIKLTNQQFQDFSSRAKGISDDLLKLEEQKSLKATIEEAINNAKGDDLEKLLLLKRRVATFGLNLGKIEYRETAEEYSRATATLLRDAQNDELIGAQATQYVAAYDVIVKERKNEKPDANKIHAAEAMQTTALTSILKDEALRERFITLSQQKLAQLKGDDAKIRDYSNNDAIVYHTLRRMDLARDFGEMVTHNVLAECKGTVNLLEALAMQVATTQADGKRAMLNIVPLFEEADTMANIPNIIKDGLANSAYKAHVDALKVQLGQPLTQQIMIAHSDNARRAGAIASRGIIHDGHRAAREAMAEYNKDKPPSERVNLEFFEGGSHSDSYRNGVRASTAVIKDFGLGKKVKSTYQGGDLPNYFNFSTSFERLAVRGLVQQVELLQDKNPVNGNDNVVDQIVMEQLARLQNEYELKYYGDPDKELETTFIGKLLNALGYRQEASVASAGTRGNRSILSNAWDMILGISAKVLRTISFSEAFQHGGLHPTCLGTENLEKYVGSALQIYLQDEKNSAKREEIEQKFSHFIEETKLPINSKFFKDTGGLTAEGLKYLYKEASPTFKDAIDKMVYGLINTRVDSFSDNLAKYQQSIKGERDTTLDEAYRTVIKDYKIASDLAYKAITGKEITAEMHHHAAYDNNPRYSLARVIHRLIKTNELSHLKTLRDKHNFIDGLEMIEAKTGLGEHTRLGHNARDTLYHGRTFMADDPMYSKAYMAELNNPRGRQAA